MLSKDTVTGFVIQLRESCSRIKRHDALNRNDLEKKQLAIYQKYFTYTKTRVMKEFAAQ